MLKGKQIVFNGKMVVLEEVSIHDPIGDEILVQGEWSQVSTGTEISAIQTAKKTKTKIGLGYSLVGVVIKKGPKARIREGQRVLTFCPHASIVKTRAIPEEVTEIPEDIPSDIAAAGIMGSVAFHVVERAGIRLGEAVGVFGQGVMGSLCMQIAKLSGARPIIAVDVAEGRLKIAKEYGADYCLHPERDDLEKFLAKLTNNKGLNVAIEATGRAKPIERIVKFLGLHGRLILTSYTFEKVSFSVHGDIVDKELTIIGAHQPKCPVEPVPYYPFSQTRNRILAMELLKEGKLKVEKLISCRVKNKDAPGIYNSLLKGNKEVSGILIDWRSEPH